MHTVESSIADIYMHLVLQNISLYRFILLYLTLNLIIAVMKNSHGCKQQISCSYIKNETRITKVKYTIQLITHFHTTFSNFVNVVWSQKNLWSFDLSIDLKINHNTMFCAQYLQTNLDFWQLTSTPLDCKPGQKNLSKRCAVFRNNLLKIYSPSDYPKCRWVCVFVGTVLKQCSIA